jgi:AbrB family looped-hinge helix DNA binding protein
MATRNTTVISTKGQVILPKAIRDQRQWPPGTRLEVEQHPEGVLLKPAAAFPATQVDALFGVLKSGRSAMTVEDMALVIAQEAKRRARN